MTLEIFGYNPRSVTAVRHAGGVCATVQYDDFCVTNHYDEGGPEFMAAIYSQKGNVLKAVDLAMAAENECEDFVEMLRTGKMTRPYEEFAMPVYFMNAVVKAYETGEKVEIQTP